MFQSHYQNFDVFDECESGDKDLKSICGVHCFLCFVAIRLSPVISGHHALLSEVALEARAGGV